MAGEKQRFHAGSRRRPVNHLVRSEGGPHAVGSGLQVEGGGAPIRCPRRRHRPGRCGDGRWAQVDDEAIPWLTAVVRCIGLARAVHTVLVSMLVVRVVVAAVGRARGGRDRRIVADALMNLEPGPVLMDLEGPRQKGSDQKQGERRQRHHRFSDLPCPGPILHGFRAVLSLSPIIRVRSPSSRAWSAILGDRRETSCRPSSTCSCCAGSCRFRRSHPKPYVA